MSQRKVILVPSTENSIERRTFKYSTKGVKKRLFELPYLCSNGELYYWKDGANSSLRQFILEEIDGIAIKEKGVFRGIDIWGKYYKKQKGINYKGFNFPLMF